jgi:hypothetical protein
LRGDGKAGRLRLYLRGVHETKTKDPHPTNFKAERFELSSPQGEIFNIILIYYENLHTPISAYIRH